MVSPEDITAAVLEKLLVECQEDFVEVWSVLWMVRYELCDGDYPIDVFQRTDTTEVRHLAFGVIAAALERGVRAGFYVDIIAAEYPPPLSPARPTEIMNRLAIEWERLGHEPSIGELAGFTSVPPKHAEQFPPPDAAA